MRLDRLYVLPLLVGCMALGACESMRPGTGGVAREDGQTIQITGGVIDGNAHPERAPIVASDPRVTVYPLDGPAANPLSVERYNSVIENTTAGGYTVFDESVKVYPLPGEPVPAFVPPHAVPPFGAAQERPLVGAPTSLTQTQSNLPPVPTVAVGTADPYANPPVSGMLRQPATLIGHDGGGQDVYQPQAAPAGGASSGVSAGRKSSPILTGY